MSRSHKQLQSPSGNRVRALLVAGCAAAILVGSLVAKPVRVIVPFSAGGGSDSLARILVREINRQSLDDTTWVVLNIPGGGGTIGSRHARNATPDGQTLLFLHDGILTAHLSGKTAYGPDAFEAVAMTGTVGMMVCVAGSSELQDLGALLDAARASPDTITFAANLGAPSYFLGRILESEADGARFRFVQSGGGARRFADLIGGHIDVTVFSVAEYLAYREGNIRALAYLGENRHERFPDVPTADEAGIPVVYENLQGWWSPAGTPEESILKNAGVLRQAMESAPVQQALAEQSIAPLFLEAEAFRGRMESKESELRRLELASLPSPPPRFENLLLPLLAILAIPVFVRPRSRKRDSAPALPLRRLGMAGLLLAAYLLLLNWSEGAFLPLTGLFLLLCFRGIIIPRVRMLPAVLVSVGIPLALFLFIEKLLGLPLP